MNTYIVQIRNAVKKGMMNSIKENSVNYGCSKEKIISIVANRKRFRILLWLSGCTIDDLLKEDQIKPM